MNRLAVRVALMLVLAAGFVSAQAFVTPFHPVARRGDLYVCDAGLDQILRLSDQNGDGDYQDAGEQSVFYSDLVGSLIITNNAAVAVGPDGTVYVADTTLDRVLALKDLDGDGTAHSPFEHMVWFDGSSTVANGSGLLLGAALGLTVDATGVVWMIASNSASAGLDAIYRLEDLGGAPGANDAGEATVWLQLPGSAIGDSIPTQIAVGPDGAIYFTDVSSTGFRSKGVYRAQDALVPNGNANDPGEVTPYFLPPTPYNNGFHYGIAFDPNGVLYLTDHNADLIWRLVDIDASGMIDAGTAEAVIYWNSPGASLVWSIAILPDGALLLCESQSPDRLLRVADDVLVNGTANDPGETRELFSATGSGFPVDDLRAVGFARAPTLALGALPAIGTSVPQRLEYESGADFAVWFSSAALTTPVYLPGLGALQLSLSPADFFGPLYGGLLLSSGTNTVIFNLPNDPQLIGAQIYFQGYAGLGGRVALTNLLPVTIL